MTTRTWDTGDSEPEDHPPLVDEDSITWLWMEVEEGVWYYVQQNVSINGNWGTGFTWTHWEALLEEYGPVREASEEEAFAVTWRYGKPRG